MHLTFLPLLLTVSTLQSLTSAHRSVHHHSEFAKARRAVSTSPAKDVVGEGELPAAGSGSFEVGLSEEEELSRRGVPVLSGFDVLVANPAAPVAPVVRVAQGAMKLAMAVETQLSTTSVEPTTSTSSADPTFSTAPPAIIAAVWTPSTTWEAPSSTWSPSPSSTWEAPSSTWEAPSSTWTPSSSSAWTPPPSSTPVYAPSSGNKKGVGFNTASLTLGFGNSISWTYNWGNQNGQDLTPGVEFYPMMWGAGKGWEWNAAAELGISRGSTHFLGFNEPDLASQANLSPSDAVALWWQYMEPYAGRVKLVSPAVTNSGSSGQGPDWLQQFINQCVGCHIDAIALHWYGDTSNIGDFYSYFPATYAKFNKPIWITEFAPIGGNQESFYNQIIPWMDSQWYIEKYAGFGCFAEGPDFAGTQTATYVNYDGSLTGLGWTYRNAV